MAAKDSLVTGKIFGGAHQDEQLRPATVQQGKKGGNARKGAAFPTLKKIAEFFENLTTIFVEVAKTVRSLSKILVSLIGLFLIAAVFVFIVKAIWLGQPLPVESVIIPIVRVCLSQIR